MSMAYYNENIRCYSDGKIERLDKRFKNPVWREVEQTSFDKDGYLVIGINRKMMKFHRVIWIAFNGDIPDGLTINHKDEVKTNNSLSNLELMTVAENNRYGTRTERATEANTNGKCSKPVVGVNIKTGKMIEFASVNEARRNGFNQGNICTCIKGKRNSHKGYKWYYKN